MTIAYPDVSNHNGGMPLQDGTVACFAKSSEGTGYRDAYYGHFKAEAERVGALFGAYHFLTQGDGAGQARFAYSIVGPAVPMMIDFEPEYDAAGNPLSLPSLADAVAFRDTYRSLGGLVRLNYLPRWYWSGHLGSPSLAPLADLALVSSGYTAYSDTGPGWAPYGGLTPAVWQYTDALPYSGQKVDFNAYRGTVDQFRALLGLAGAQPSSLEVAMQDAVFYVADGPEKGAIYVRTSDGQYAGVGSIENRDALVALLGVEQRSISGGVHAVFLALAASGRASVTMTDAQAQVIGTAIAAKLPTTITLTGTETGKLS